MRFLLTVSLCFFLALPVFAAETLKVAIGTGDSKSQKLVETLVREAYKRAGLGIIFLQAPGYIGSALLIKDKADAVAIRVEDIIVPSDKLIKVPTAIGKVVVVAISLADLPDINKAENLQNYKVGTSNFFTFIGDLFPFQKIKWHPDIISLIRKLKAGQLDYVLYVRQVFQMVAGEKFPELKFKYKKLRERKVFHYLHKDKEYLKDRLSLAFKSMWDDGYIVKTSAKFGYTLK